MKYIVYADTHFYGVHKEVVVHSDMIKECISNDNVLALGDIYDKANCRKRASMELVNKFYRLQGMLEHNYLTGNHDAFIFEENISRKFGNVLACHGQHIFYSHKRQIKWVKKDVGCSEFKRKISKSFNFIRTGVNFDWYLKLKIKRYKKKIIGELIKNDCDTIVMGHLHPKKMIDMKLGNKRVVVVPKGRTEVEL